jgi:hypothetical protein
VESFLKTRQASLFGKGGVRLGEVYLNVRILLLSHLKLFHLQPLFLSDLLQGGHRIPFLDSHRAPIIFSCQFDVNLGATPFISTPHDRRFNIGSTGHPRCQVNICCTARFVVSWDNPVKIPQRRPTQAISVLLSML